MRKYLAIAALFLCAVTSEAFSQCGNTPPSPARPYIKVVPSSAAEGYHYKIRTFSSISAWSDLNGGGYTETDFFPIGWYLTKDVNLTQVHNAGATTALMYAHIVIDKYKAFIGGYDLTYAKYKAALDYWLQDMDAAGMKVIVDIGPFTSAFNQWEGSHASFADINNLRDLLCTIRADKRIFAIYISDEPEGERKRTAPLPKAPVSAASLSTIAAECRAIDPYHPIIIVPTEPNTSLFNGKSNYGPEVYDIMAPDPYVLGTGYDYNANFRNDKSILGIKSQAAWQTTMSKNLTPPGFSLQKWAPMSVIQGQDITVGSRTISADEMRYQVLSPLIRGGQGLLFWWHDPGFSSTPLIADVHTAITALTNTNNVKSVSLTDVIMKGTDKKSATKLENIFIDGNSSVLIAGTNVPFTNQGSLAQYYTHHNFNQNGHTGSIYKLNGSTSWNETNLRQKLQDSGYTQSGVTSLHATGSNLFSGVHGCGRILKTSPGGTTWGTSMGCVDVDPTRTFATRPDGTVFMVKNHTLYRYDTPTSTWVSVSSLTVTVGGESVNAPTATSMVWKDNSTVVVGTANDASNQGIYVSNNGGLTWASSSTIDPENAAPHTPLRRSGGQTSLEEIWSLAKTNQGAALAGCDGKLIMSSNTTYTAWTTINSSGLPNYPVWAIEVIPTSNRIYIGTGDGIYYTDNISAVTVTWTKVTGLPALTNVWDLAANSQTAYAATNKGVFSLSISGSAATNITDPNSNSGDNLQSSLAWRSTNATIDVDCRTVMVSGSDVYVGTWEYPNSFASATSDIKTNYLNSIGSGSTASIYTDEQPLFSYTVKKYGGSYYIMAVNDFRPSLALDFNLDDVLENNETAYRVVQMNMDGTESQADLNFYDADATKGSLGSAAFTLRLGAYDARVYRVDVFNWTPVSTITRECNPSLYGTGFNPNITDGGGITFGDFDNNGQKDFLVMWIPDMSNQAAEPFRYKIGWNLTSTGPGALNYTMSSNNYANGCFGESQGIGWDVRGGDVKAYNLYDFNGNPNREEIFFMGVDATNQFRVKLDWDMYATGSTQPVQSTPLYWANFPTIGYAMTPVNSTPPAYTGAGMTVQKLQNSPNPAMMFMELTDVASGANRFRVSSAFGTYLDTISNIASAVKYPVISGLPPYQETPGSIGWTTRGAGMDIGNVAPSYKLGVFDKDREMVCGGIETTGNIFRFMVYNFDPATGLVEQLWRPFIQVPIRPNGDITTTVKDAGIALGDIDGDGDDDIAIMAIAQDTNPNLPAPQPTPIFVRFGINKMIDKPTSYHKTAEIQEDVAPPATPGNSSKAATLLSNQPNPFDINTIVTYSLDQAGRVELEVYSMLGEVVLHHDAGSKQPGSYSLPFSADNLPNGIYICRLKVNGTVVNSTKMVLAR